MGLGFLVPAFLAGLAALAVPVLLHLRHKDRDHPHRFPSLMFLEKLPIRTERRQRISDWPLLLVRLLLLALLVLAFARPVFTNRPALGGDSRSKATVVLIDRSLSMGYTGVWSRALDSARAIINRQGNGDRVAVVAYDDAADVLQRLTTDKGAAIGALVRLAPLHRGTRLAPALRVARQLLLDAPFAAAEIVVISDLQRVSTQGIAGVELPTGVRVRGVGVGVPDWHNSAVRTVEAKRVQTGVQAGASGDGARDRTMLAVKARVQSHALPQARTVTASLSVNGREANTQQVTLAPNGETVVTFAPVPAPDGSVAVRVALPADALAGDDSLVAVVPRDDALHVALVAPDAGAETLYLERALAIGQAPRVVVDRLSAPPTGEALARTGVVVFWDVAPPPSAALSSWMANGGGVVVVAGRRLAARRGDLPDYLPVKAVGMADRLSDRGGTLRDLRLEHPMFAPFRDMPDALRDVRLWRYPRFDARPGADILARFDDGVPAILEVLRTGGTAGSATGTATGSSAGRAVTLALPLDNTAGDFPLQPAFLPFVRQLMLHASGRDATPLWHLTGESWIVPTSIPDAVVTTPTGALVRPRADSAGNAVSLTDAGLYTAYRERATGAPAAELAVNVGPAESELTPIDTTELLLGVRTVTDSSATAAAADRARAAGATETPEVLERRQNPWRILLMIAALAVLVETLLATTGRRGVSRRVAGSLSPTASSNAGSPVTTSPEERR